MNRRDDITKKQINDFNDVKRLINKIIADGTVGRVKRMLSAYRNSNTIRKGGSVRLL